MRNDRDEAIDLHEVAGHGMGLQWTGGTLIVLGVTFFAVSMLMLPAAHHVLFGAIAGGVSGFGYGLVRYGMLRQRDGMSRYVEYSLSSPSPTDGGRC